jgi:hypothetical protein
MTFRVFMTPETKAFSRTPERPVRYEHRKCFMAPPFVFRGIRRRSCLDRFRLRSI